MTQQNFNFGERFSELILEQNITVYQIAKAIGVNDETVRLWKTGQRTIRLPNLLKLADFFGCSIEYLIGRTEIVIDYSPKSVLSFSESLRAVMAEKGISRYRLVKDLDFYDSDFTNWKQGSQPSLYTLVALADYLGVSIDYLVGRDR